jgi:hypothetical protein
MEVMFMMLEVRSSEVQPTEFQPTEVQLDPDHPAGMLLKEYAAQARNLTDAVAALAGPESGLHGQSLEILARAMHEWERIASNRGLLLPTICFVGDRNAGKSTLAGLLLKDARVREKLPSGEAEARKTQRLHWFGPRRPSGLAVEYERHWQVDAQAMADLGQAYMILDAPGAGDMDPRLQELAASALSSARYKVLVLDAGRIESEDVARYMHLGDGSVILPAVHLRAEQTSALLQDEAGLAQRIDRSLRGLVQALPRSTVLPCVLLPDMDSMGDAQQAEDEVRTRLAWALRAMLDEHGDQAEGRVRELAASWERFEANVRALAASLLTSGMREAFARLEEKTAQLPLQAVDHLLQEERRLQALVRADLRLNLMERIPLWAFPFRSLVSLFCVTTGAWDRVALALAGSLPSLALAGVNAGKNIGEQAQAQALLRDNLHHHLHGFARREMADTLERFAAAVARAAGRKQTDQQGGPQFEVHGCDSLAATWRRVLGEAVGRAAMSKPAVQGLAVAASLIFLFLLGAPLWHAYGQYIPAAWGSWSGDWSPQALAAYPSLPAGFWLTALALGIIPVLVLALLTVALALRGSRARRCIAILRERYPPLAVQESNLRIVIRDARIAAARLLLRSGHGSGFKRGLRAEG